MGIFTQPVTDLIIGVERRTAGLAVSSASPEKIIDHPLEKIYLTLILNIAKILDRAALFKTTQSKVSNFAPKPPYTLIKIIY